MLRYYQQYQISYWHLSFVQWSYEKKHNKLLEVTHCAVQPKLFFSIIVRIYIHYLDNVVYKTVFSLHIFAKED